MSYYLAPSLVALRNEVKVLDPGRDTTSDGWIGDTSHQARVSDHNPAPPTGVVRAVDIDDDFTTVAHKRLVVAEVVADRRTAYVITDGRIWKRRTGEWEAYYGADSHFGHIHVSILHTRTAETDTRPWLSPAARPKPQQEEDVTPQDKEDIAELVVKKLLRADLGKPGGGDTVGVALQSGYANSKAILAELKAKP